MILSLTPLLYSQSNGNDIYDYLNAILFIGVIIMAIVYLPRIRAKQSRFDFTFEFLKLTAYILKSDQKVTAKELDFVYRFFVNEFGSELLPTYKSKLAAILKTDKSINYSLKSINNNQDPTTKLQLLNFLVKITIIDGYLTQNELKSLLIITKGIGLIAYQLESILAMYSFITEKEFTEQKSQKRRYKSNSHSKLDEAYKILELSKTATPSEIKKAYRKLVILYHPDKAMHLEKIYQKSAKEMYQKVTDSYELLKLNIDFK